MALVHFNTKSVATMPVPIPPHAEQRRIVEKVHQLMTVCDELEAVLATSQAGKGRLLQALLEGALESTSEVRQVSRRSSSTTTLTIPPKSIGDLA
jgi:type I restriction enzyme S subunit